MKITQVILFGVAVCSAAAAQSVAGAGAVGGFVRDNYGDGLPDTKVVIYNKSLGMERTVATTDDGVFQAPGLAPGPDYILKISRTGFAPWESKSFEVPLGQTLNFRIQLEPDTPTPGWHTRANYIEESSKTGLANVFTGDQVTTLPSNPRRLDSLSTLAAVVNTTPGDERVAILGTTFGQPLFSDGVVIGDGYFTDGTLRASPTALDPTFGFRLAPLDLPVADAISRIPRDIVPDLPDRVITATALARNIPLVTRDEKIHSAEIATIW